MLALQHAALLREKEGTFIVLLGIHRNIYGHRPTDMNISVVLDELQTYFRDGRYQFTLLPSALLVSGVYSFYKYVLRC